MKMIKNVGWVFIGCIITIAFTQNSSIEKETSKSKFKTQTHILNDMNFADETVPVHIADVRERLDKELVVNKNYHSNTTLVIKRANRVFPIMEPILKQYGIPDDC